jgi:hypothetical protein
MKSKTELLNSLFDDWEKNIPEYKGKFIRDGIVNEKFYESSSPKILFVMKEPNNPEQKAGDFREWWKNELYYTFSYRIAEWSYGLLNNFPAYDIIWSSKENIAHRAMQQVSLMNIKKIGGKGNSNFVEIDSHFNMSKEFLQKQIDIMCPEIIILGISFWAELREKLFPQAEWTGSGFNIEIGKHNGYKLIDFYHPSSRTPPSASYCLLKNIISSDNFKSL